MGQTGQPHTDRVPVLLAYQFHFQNCSQLVALEVAKRDVLARIADAVIKRVISETPPNDSIKEALRRAYPFDNDPTGAEVWDEALVRNAEIIYEHEQHWRKSIAGLRLKGS